MKDAVFQGELCHQNLLTSQDKQRVTCPSFLEKLEGSLWDYPTGHLNTCFPSYTRLRRLARIDIFNSLGFIEN